MTEIDRIRLQQQLARRLIEAGDRPPEPPKPEPKWDSYLVIPDVWRTIAEGVAGEKK